MICKNCGFEYVDGLKECPNCQTPNVPEEPKVMTKEERDTFGGVTIETTPDPQPNGQDYKVYEGQAENNEEETQPKSYGFKVRSFGGLGFLWQLIIIIVIIGFVFFVLPTLALFTLIAAVCYYLYVWLF